MSTGTAIALAAVAALIIWLVVLIRRAIQRRDLAIEISETRRASTTVRALVEHSNTADKQSLLDRVSTAQTHLSAAEAALAAGEKTEAIRLLDLAVAELHAARVAVQPDENEYGYGHEEEETDRGDL